MIPSRGFLGAAILPSPSGSSTRSPRVELIWPPISHGIIAMFPPPKLPCLGQLLLITDELAAPAEFFLHRRLGAHLKDTENSKCVILSVSEGLTRWKAIAAKSVSSDNDMDISPLLTDLILKNVNLATHLASDSLVFIDVFATVDPPPASLGSTQPALRSVYEMTRDALGRLQVGADIMVILDDITSLEWTGVSLVDLIRFSRALRSLCLKVPKPD